GLSSNLKYDYAVTVTFTDDPLNSSGSTPIYGRHLAELREAADAWREFATLTRMFTYVPQTGAILASHFVGAAGVVDALNAARNQMSLEPFAYSSVSPPAINGFIRKEHVQQMRTSVR